MPPTMDAAMRLITSEPVPLWDDCEVQMGEEVPIEPDWDQAAQAAPDYEMDQRVNG